MEFLATNWLYILAFGAMMYMMFRGGGCCGGGHMGGEHTEYVEHGTGHIENSTVMDSAQDPVCGMYVSKKDAIVRQINGRTYYFCSQNCANEFERKLLH